MNIINKTVYKNKWFEVINKHYLKEKKKYYTIKIPNSAVILPVTKSKDFILIKQYRESLDDYSLELPAGFVEDGETHFETAQRELLEETGYKSNKYTYLGIGRLMINRTNSIQHLYVAENTVKHTLPKDKTKILKLNQKELFDLILNDKFVQLSGQGLILKYLIHNKSI